MGKFYGSVNNNLFVKSPSYVSYFVFLVFVSIVFIIFDYKYKKFEGLRLWLNAVNTPVITVAQVPKTIGKWANTKLVSKEDLLKRNEELEQHNLLVSSKLQKLASIESANDELRKLLDMSQRQEHDSVQIASVHSYDNTQETNELIIDKGLNDKVYIGQAVLDSNGFLGQIIHVSFSTSTVLLLDSTRHFTPVKIIRNSYTSIAVGNGSGEKLNLKRVKEDADIIIGDVVVTSGAAGVFAEDYKFGIVTNVSPITGNFLKVEVKAFAQTNNVQKVLLVWDSNSVVSQKNDSSNEKLDFNSNMTGPSYNKSNNPKKNQGDK